MGRRPIKNKKQPSEYPQFSFRISKEEKERINKLIETIQIRLNKKRGPDEPFLNKNDVILHALKEGLELIKNSADSLFR